MKLSMFMAAVAVVFTIAGCSSSKASGTISADLDTYEGLSGAIARGDSVLVYDVRTPEELAAGHIPGALNIPYDVIGEKIPAEYKDSVLVVYCRSGVRSAKAYRTLVEKGFTHVYDFGGIGKWKGDLE